jgi:hypothetical protein
MFGESGGNLAVADGVLLVAEPYRLAVFGESGSPSRPREGDIASAGDGGLRRTSAKGLVSIGDRPEAAR